MNENDTTPDPFEEELAKLVPNPLSDNFQRTLADRLGEEADTASPPKATASRSPLAWGIFAAVAAILIAGGIWWFRGLEQSPQGLVEQPKSRPRIPNHPLPPDAEHAPTLVAYNQVLAAGDTDQLEQLLDYHGACLLPKVPGEMQ